MNMKEFEELHKVDYPDLERIWNVLARLKSNLDDENEVTAMWRGYVKGKRECLSAIGNELVAIAKDRDEEKKRMKTREVE